MNDPRRFANGAPGGAPAGADDPAPRTGAEARARDAVRALPPAEARAVWRSRLRDAFVEGTIESPVPRAAAPRRRAHAWFAVPAAVAAALIAAFALNAGPRWEVISVTGPAPIVVNDLLVPPRQVEALTRVLQPGAHVHVPVGDELMVLGRGALALDLTPGTDLVLPGVPGRWFGRQAHARLATGEVRVTTGARFHGARLAIATPEAEVEVHGTTLAVIREPTGTCVCVLEGTVMVGPSSTTMAPVAHGHLHYIYTDGHQKNDAMRPNERVQLALFRAARAEAMAP